MNNIIETLRLQPSFPIEVVLSEEQRETVGRLVARQIEEFSEVEALKAARDALIEQAKSTTWGVDDADIAVAETLFGETISDAEACYLHEGKVLDITEFNVGLDAAVHGKSPEFGAIAGCLGPLAVAAIHRESGAILATYPVYVPSEEEPSEIMVEPNFELGFVMDPTKDWQEVEARVVPYSDQSLVIKHLSGDLVQSS